MRLSVSNIGWAAEMDGSVYALMKQYGFTGLEIAPSRIIPSDPYDHLRDAVRFADRLRLEHGFVIPSMQSLWFGLSDRIFGSAAERDRLAAYTKKAVLFAESIGCANLVFGCPRNRVLPDHADPGIAVSFFRELGGFACLHHAVIALEANPPIYHTNYINTTGEAIRLVRDVGSDGFRLNLDIGTMVENGEDLSVLYGAEELIHHVHISEPGLVPLKERSLHRDLAFFLRSFSYPGFISIEVGRQEDPAVLETMMNYVSGIFAQ